MKFGVMGRVSVSLTALALAGVAHAQDTTGTDDSGSGIEEITVTVQRPVVEGHDVGHRLGGLGGTRAHAFLLGRAAGTCPAASPALSSSRRDDAPAPVRRYPRH